MSLIFYKVKIIFLKLTKKCAEFDYLSPLLNKNLDKSPSFFGAIAKSNVLVIVRAVNILIRTPIPKVKANP